MCKARQPASSVLVRRPFADKIALITGGTSGMGLATARRLLAEGAQVVITGRDTTRLDAAVEDLDGGDRVLARPTSTDRT